MKLPVNKTPSEQRLIRAGWKNRPFSDNPEKCTPYPRGVWFNPGGAGPYTLAVAVLLTTTPEPKGKPFAVSDGIAAERRNERMQLTHERHAERAAADADRRERAEARRAERALR